MKKEMLPQKKVVKPVEETTPGERWVERIRKGLGVLPSRIWSFGAIAMLIVVIGLFMFAPADREAPRTTPSTPPTTGVDETANGQSQTVGISPEVGIPEKELIFIQSVRLQPSQPTRMDSLKVEVVAAPTATERLAYAYRWKVNDQVIKDEAGDTLNLTLFKKGDLITVTVTPSYGDIYGHAVESPVVAIHSAAPSLELKTERLARKAGEPVELQLVSTAPDGSQVKFSLEPPLVPGMTIDGRSGKISWLIHSDQKGSVRFGAAVEDDNQTKVIKTFDITVD